MDHADRTIRQHIARLRQCSGLIRSTPALWSLWWSVLRAVEAEAARLERTLARQRRPPAHTFSGEVVDLGEWRRRRAEALVWHRRPTGDAA